MLKKTIVVLLLAIAAQSADTPQIPDAKKLVLRKAQVSIRDAQLQLQNLQLQMADLQMKWVAANDARTKAEQELSAATDAAFDAAKVKKADYDLDADLNLVPKPKSNAKR